MTGSWWLDLLLGIAAGLLLAWAALIAALAIMRPRGGLAREALRLLPDVLGLLPRLAADRSLPRGVRIRLALLLAYLAFPIDLVPDFIPVVGYADDAIIFAAVLRSVVRHAGIEELRRHWHGSSDGFAALCRITGLTPSGTSGLTASGDAGGEESSRYRGIPAASAPPGWPATSCGKPPGPTHTTPARPGCAGRAGRRRGGILELARRRGSPCRPA